MFERYEQIQIVTQPTVAYLLTLQPSWEIYHAIWMSSMSLVLVACIFGWSQTEKLSGDDRMGSRVGLVLVMSAAIVVLSYHLYWFNLAEHAPRYYAEIEQASKRTMQTVAKGVQ